MDRKIHIQHLMLSLEPGGLENGVVNVVNHLNPDQFRSSICCLQRAGTFADRVKAGEVAIHQMGWRGGIDLLLPLKLAALFRRTKTDVVHSRNSAAFLYGFLGAKIAGVHSIIHSEHGQTFNERKLRFWMQRAFSQYTDAIFAVSATLKRDLVAHVGIPAARLDVLYNGVDPFRFMRAEREEIRLQHGIKSDEFVVGSIGRLVPIKNYPLLLRAVQTLGIERVTVALVGDGPERGALEAIARSLGLIGRVRFLGHRDDVSKILSAMDVFVLPSISEGMSNTLLEAMSAGVAVVASNVGGTSEIVRDGIDGLLFESGDEAALRNILNRLLIDFALRARLGFAGRERVIQHFSLESMIAQYERLYQSTFCRKRPSTISALRKRFIRIAASSHVLSPILALRKSNPLILLYHGVSDNTEQSEQLRNHDRKHAALSTFRQQLSTLRRSRRVIPLSEMVEGLRDGEDMRNTVAITFDDGYENNFRLAAPVLMDFKMSATFFLTTGFIDTDQCAWTDRVEIMLDHTGKASVTLPWEGQAMSLRSLEEKRNALRKIKGALKQLPNSQCLVEVAELERQLMVTTPTADGDYRFMSWAQARHLRSADFEVGAHSITHPILSQIPLEEAKHQILASREDVCAQIGQCSTSFAYPNGKSTDYTKEIVDFCSQHFRAALSTNPGPAVVEQIFELRRLTLPDGQMASHIEWMLFREH